MRKRIVSGAVLTVAAMSAMSAMAAFTTVINENFEDDTLGAFPGNSGSVGVWVPNQWQSTPYYDVNNANPDTNWQVEVDNRGVGGSQSAYIDNIHRGFWEPGAVSGGLQDFTKEGFLQATSFAGTPGQKVHGSVSIRYNDGIVAFGLTSSIANMAALSNRSNPQDTTPPPTLNKYDANPDIVAGFTFGDGYEGGEKLDAWSGGARYRLDPDPQSIYSYNTFEFQYTVGATALDYLKLNGATVTIQASSQNGTPGFAPPTNSTGGIDGIYFSDAKLGTDYLIDNIFLEIESSNVNATWAANASGDWSTAANWLGGVPNGVDAIANLGSVITSPQTGSSNIPVTAGALHFNNSGGFSITGTAPLTIQTSSGSGILDVLQGDQKITMPTIFAANTDITVANGATLTLGSTMTIKANKTVTKTGNLLIHAPLVIETGGVLSLGAGPATVVKGAPSLASGAKIDVKNHSLLIDYQGTSSPAATITSQLMSGYNNGAWNGEGIDTSSSTSATGLGWKDTPGTESILVKYTYYGDTDLNGAVDSIDFNALVTGYGLTTGANWVQGDFNYDGKVNTLDYNSLAGNFAATPIAGVSLGSVVPEPSTLALVGLGVLTGRRRR